MSFEEARKKARQVWNAYRKEQDPKRKAELYAEFAEARLKMKFAEDKKD